MAANSPFVPMLARVRDVERPSANFVRVTFTGLDDLETGHPVYDLRIKLIFPGPGAPLPALDPDEDWYAGWLALPEGARGSMRTYSIRALGSDAGGAWLTVDFVVHDDGLAGPAASWAMSAREGAELIVIGPRRGIEPRGGIEYAPGHAASVVLAGDETAAPAIARIIEDAGAGARIDAFIEVPAAGDALAIAAPVSTSVTWLPRGRRAHGALLADAVLTHLGTTGQLADPEVDDSEALVWETPGYSGSGEPLSAPGQAPAEYFWIAGESGVITRLRRTLVKDLGFDRSQVAFMGYWKRGVAMRG